MRHIVNTLAVTQFLYPLQILPSPPEECITYFNKLVKGFIWDNKKSKISNVRLQQEWEYGGVKLVDLMLKDKSLKLSAFLHIINADPNSLLNTILASYANISIDFLKDSNLQCKDIPLRLKAFPFLYDILSSWCYINFYHPTSCEDILSQRIWYNSNIRIANKVIPFYQRYHNHILMVENIYNSSTKTMLDYKQFMQKFPNINVNFVFYASILAAIPKAWCRILKKSLDVPSN